MATTPPVEAPPATKTKNEVAPDMTTIEATSENGKPYEAGMPKGKEMIHEELKLNVTAVGATTVSVNWTPGHDWQSTDVNTKNLTGIERWKIDDFGTFSIFRYRLSIHCNRIQKYRFFDQEPDSYDLLVTATGSDHLLDYNSAAPTIVSIALI